jgi:predicted RNA-binding protein with PUA-like domain
LNYWIFQAVLERYPLLEYLIVGEEATWYATRYRRMMNPGDIVFFWQAGPPKIRGIYGWGNLISKPFFLTSRNAYGVNVIYEKRLTDHITIQKIKSNTSLKNLLILRAAQATNFLIKEFEARAIAEMMKRDERPEVLQV